VPWFGRISAGRLGMPLFTILIGLVDGFNPCAMWVLLFLLSVLVNLRDRRKILAVAGTFVVISGLAYFMFMAAWLNVFLWVGIFGQAGYLCPRARHCDGRESHRCDFRRHDSGGSGEYGRIALHGRPAGAVQPSFGDA